MKNKSFTVLLLTIITGILFNFLILGCETVSPPTPWVAEYAVGDTGPAGGLIFYVSEAGFTVDGLSGTFHYLEASREDMKDEGNQWGGRGTLCGVYTEIGKGYANTNTLQACTVPHPFEEDYHGQAKAAWNYSVTNDGTIYDDWWLPSKDELLELSTTYASLSDKSVWNVNTSLWSSSEHDERTAWCILLSDENIDGTTYTRGAHNFSKGWEFRTIAVRAF